MYANELGITTFVRVEVRQTTAPLYRSKDTSIGLEVLDYLGLHCPLRQERGAIQRLREQQSVLRDSDLTACSALVQGPQIAWAVSLALQGQEETRNKCIATSNKCLTSSNKKLLGAPGIATRSKDATRNKCNVAFGSQPWQKGGLPPICDCGITPWWRCSKVDLE